MTEVNSPARLDNDQELVDYVRNLFVEVLDYEDEVTADDDFFDIGGNSLMAALVVADIRRRTGAPVNVRAILKARTPEAVALAIGKLRHEGASR